MKNNIIANTRAAIGRATGTAVAKTGATLRLGGAVVTDVVATSGQVAGAAVAVVGGACALLGVGVYVAGKYAYDASSRLQQRATDAEGRAFEDLFGSREADAEVTTVEGAIA